MDIGEPRKVWEVVPLEAPAQPPPEPAPPLEEPEQEREPVPAE